MHDRELVYNSKLNFIEQEYPDNGVLLEDDDRLSFQVPYLAITKPEGSGVVDGNSILLVNGTLSESIATTSFLFDSPEDTITNVDFTNAFTVSGSFFLRPDDVTLTIRVSYFWISKDLVLKESVELGVQNITQSDGEWSAHFDIDLHRQGLNVKAGDSILLQIEIQVSTLDHPFVATDLKVTPDSEDYNLDVSSITTFEKTVSKIILPHEFFTFWIELLTGEKNSFYSEFFGRTDILNTDGTQKYAQNGEGAYLSLCDGHMLRNLPLTENPFNTSFMDAFKAYHYIFCLSGQTEFIGNTEVFRIEKWKDAVSQDTVLDLGELVAEWEASINDDLTFSSINIGYKPRKHNI